MKQYIILKVDDFTVVSSIIESKWKPFIDYLGNKNVKANFGVIGNTIKDTRYSLFIKDLHDSNVIEFWNHGYYHGAEFGKDYNYQLECLKKTQELGKEKLGITFQSFGAPNGIINKDTVKAFEDSEDLKIWFVCPNYLYIKRCGNNYPSKMLLETGGLCKIEYPCHNPNYNKFLDNYSSSKEYIVLQTHPLSWGKKEFENFTKIIDFLISDGVMFVTAYEYYKTVKNRKGDGGEK